MEVHIADVNFFVGVILNCPYMSGLNLSSNAELKTVVAQSETFASSQREAAQC